MNIVNMRALHDFVRDSTMTFSMFCATAIPSRNQGGCLMAHAATLWPEARGEAGSYAKDDYSFRTPVLMRILDLDKDQFDMLCYDMALIAQQDKEKALRLLRNFMDHGDFDDEDGA